MTTSRTSAHKSVTSGRNRACRALAVLALALLALAGCSDGGSARPRAGERSTSTTTDNVLSGFVAFGDFGGGVGQLPVAHAIEQWAASHRVDVLVSTGDNVYDLGEPVKYPAQLDAPYRSLRASRPLWATLGNHDAPHGAEELRYLKLPPLPFVRELPGAQLLFVDANHPDATQAAWLDQQLSAAGPPVQIVVFHQPAYSCGVHGSTAAVDQLWVPVFERHRVNLVLNGHDHDYERFAGPAGVTYVVTGGGGQTLSPILPLCAPRATRRASSSRHHFTYVEIREHSIRVQAVATDDTVFDDTTLQIGSASR